MSLSIDLTFWQAFFMVLDYAIKAVAIGIVPEGRRPSSSNAWLLAILLLPFVGLPLFLLMGSPYINRRRHRIQQEANEMIDDITAATPDHPEDRLPSEVESLIHLNRELTGFPCVVGHNQGLHADYDECIRAIARAIDAAEEYVEFEGLPARICWLGYNERHKAGLRFNELVAEGKISAPIVIGRDHLDSGSVASPYRETEAMLDGTDAVADWPLLNALTSTSSGATWVSIHHGGGVGIGRSIHAGQVTVADGTDLAAAKLRSVLTNDPGMGVIRHVDAGYTRAQEVAEERGVRIPMEF